jgi:cytochrome c-type biogenesis protein CcmH/NrfG
MEGPKNQKRIYRLFVSSIPCYYQKRKESNMKKETVILMVVIALLVGFAIGATVGILYMINKGEKGVEGVATVQKPQIAPRGAPAPAPPGIDSIEAASKIQTLKEIIKKDPKNLTAWVELGNLYFDSDQLQEAIEAYSRYLAIKPDNPDVRTDMGIMYRKLGQFDRAIEEFRKAAQSDPKHANSRYNIGIVLLHDKEDIKGAIKAWEEYLKVDPNSERAQRIRTQIEKMKAMPAPTK